jgi:hypothetical protein
MKRSSFMKILLFVIIVCEIVAISTYEDMADLIGIILIGICIGLVIVGIHIMNILEKKKETEVDSLLDKRKAILQICTIVGIALLLGVMVFNLSIIFFLIGTLGVVMISVPVFYYIHNLE